MCENWMRFCSTWLPGSGRVYSKPVPKEPDFSAIIPQNPAIVVRRGVRDDRCDGMFQSMHVLPRLLLRLQAADGGSCAEDW